MKVSILIPCYNEELTIERCLLSCINQSRPADEIIVVDDSSTDGTMSVLRQYEEYITIVQTSQNTGNKSYAQEFGLRFVTGDVFVTTDGDSMLHRDFIKIIEADMKDDSIAAVAGYVKSLKYNWITASRALDYAISQNIDKLAQDYVGFIFVIPGTAGAFRTSVFRDKIFFSHDTITEDLDFTYRLNKMGLKIKYDRSAICFTQDPPTFKAYVNQMRRWFGGGWQNFEKHVAIPERPGMALELSLIYGEGLAYSVILFVLPILNLYLAFYVFLLYCSIILLLGLFASIKEKRPDLMLALPGYIFLKFVNSYVFLEQFIREIILGQKNLKWFKPGRVKTKL